MTIAPAYRLHAGNDTAILALASKVIDKSGVVDLLMTEPPATNRNGRPAELPPYNLRSVLICGMEIMWSGDVFSCANIVRRLWFDYSDNAVADIGLPHLRDEDRKRAMRPDVALEELTVTQMREAERALNAEYQRLWRFLDRSLKPVDTNPLPASKRQIRGDLDKARMAEELIAPSALLKQVMNRIVAASVEVHNDMYYPESGGPLDAILKDWTGDVAIDEHVMTADLGEGTGAAPERVNSANQQARAFAHIRRTKFGSGIGLTFAVASSRPGRREVPAIATGMAINDPSPGSIPGLFDALDGVAANLRPPISGNRTQYVVVDMGYTSKPTLAEGALERGYGLVMKSPGPWGNVFDLNKDSAKKGGKVIAHTGKSSGPFLFNGACVCPGAARATLNGPRFDVPAKPKTGPSVEDSKSDFEDGIVDTATGELITDESPATRLQKLVDHHMAEAVISRSIMPTHGRPVAATARKRGRPRIGEPEAPKVFRLSVQCPARAGLVQCHLFKPDGETAEEARTRASLPHVPQPPLTLSEAPAVCHTQFSTVEMNEEQFNRWQPMMAGTWEHEDIYVTARSRNEWFHSQLTHKEGGNLGLGTIEVRKNAPFSIAVAMAAAVTNLKILQSWQEDLIMTGKAPMHGGAHRKAERAAAIKAEITKYMRPDMG